MPPKASYIFPLWEQGIYRYDRQQTIALWTNNGGIYVKIMASEEAAISSSVPLCIESVQVSFHRPLPLFGKLPCRLPEFMQSQPCQSYPYLASIRVLLSFASRRGNLITSNFSKYFQFISCFFRSRRKNEYRQEPSFTLRR